MRKLKKIVAFMLCGIMFLCVGCGNSANNETGRSSENGTNTQVQENETDSQEMTGETTEETENNQAKIDNFEMTLLDGTKTSFEEYKGKKVLLNFWATWCGPCVGEMPAFQKLSEEYPEELVILAVNCSEDKDTVQKFIDNNSYTFPVVLDTDGAIQTMFGGVYSIPVTVIIDEEGCIVSSHVGASDADTMYETYKAELSLE